MNKPTHNPYAPPAGETVESPDEDIHEKSVAMVCAYLKWMGIAGLLLMSAYVGFATPFAFAMGREMVGHLVYALVILTVNVSFLWLVLRTAITLPDQFAKLYHTVRLLLIIFGMLGCPFFTLPAIFAAVHLERARNSKLHD